MYVCMSICVCVCVSACLSVSVSFSVCVLTSRGGETSYPPVLTRCLVLCAHRYSVLRVVVCGGVLVVCLCVWPVSLFTRLSVGAAVPTPVCRWGLCPCCPGVGRCLSGVNISSSSASPLCLSVF